MKTATKWFDEIDDCEHSKETFAPVSRETIMLIQANALIHASEMNCANHVPPCNCDVCAFKRRIFSAGKTLEAYAAA